MGPLLVEPLPYCAVPLDRGAEIRSDEAAVRAASSRADAELLPFWQGRFLPGAHADPADLRRRVDPTDVVLLGFADGRPVLAADLSSMAESDARRLTGAEAAVDLRAVVPSLPAARAAVLGYAKGILHWAAGARFCGRCGGSTTPVGGGTSRRCSGCGHVLFPRIEPAVIVVVETGPPPRCLLARHVNAEAGRYATLAGFVEVGEGLEDAVRREVREETGVDVGEVRYRGSQAWPFPAGLMVGFHATARTETIRVDRSELAEARWFTPPEAAAIAAETRRDSIEHHLLNGWLDSLGSVPAR